MQEAGRETCSALLLTMDDNRRRRGPQTETGNGSTNTETQTKPHENDYFQLGSHYVKTSTSNVKIQQCIVQTNAPSSVLAGASGFGGAEVAAGDGDGHHGSLPDRAEQHNESDWRGGQEVLPGQSGQV